VGRTTWTVGHMRDLKQDEFYQLFVCTGPYTIYVTRFPRRTVLWLGIGKGKPGVTRGRP